MAKFNIFVHLQAYADQNVSNNPSKNYFKWSAENQGISSDKPESLQIELAPGETRSLFNGSRSLAHDGTTEYDLTLKPGTSNTYVLEASDGTLPNFRAARTTGADATTEITITKNGSVLTFASTGGTPLDLIVGSVQVGDTVSLGTVFNQANRGQFSVIAVTATSFSVENAGGQAEGPITLGASFGVEIEIFSALGVQKGDKLRISGGFSPASLSTYDVTDVYANRLEFYSTKVLPNQSSVLTNAVAAYFSSKQLIYIETTGKIDLTINGAAAGDVESFVGASPPAPGMYLRKSTMWSASITNTGLSPVSVYVAAIE